MKSSGKSELLIFSAILMSFISLNTYAQVGGSAVPFLLISPDARASGMGEVGTAIADDINAIYWNPGGLAFLDYFKSTNNYSDEDEKIPYRQIALSFSPWLPQFHADLFYSYGTIGQYFEELDGTVAFNFVFMNLGEFTKTAVNGQTLGKFISNEFAVGFSYGTMIAPDFGAGLQLRYIRSNLTPTTIGQQDAGIGNSAAFDLGLLWKPTELSIFGWKVYDKQDAFRINLGMNLQNVGPKITYIVESDPLPTTLRLGTAIQLVDDEFNDLKFAFDFAKLLVKRYQSGASDPLPKSLVSGWENAGGEMSFGFEYWYEKIIALRMGYFTEPETQGNRQYYNFGAGVRYDIFRFDFSFINTIEKNHPLANTMRFSFLIDWN
jgi:hypothetical protein